MKPMLSKLAKNISSLTKGKGPVFAAGAGILCFGLAVVSAVNAKEKIVDEIYKKSDEMKIEPEALPVKDKILIVAKHSWPTIVSFGAGTACIIGSNKEMWRRNAALAATSQLTERMFNEYKHKVIETIGENKEKEINDKVVEDNMRKLPVPTEIFYGSKDEKVLFCDTFIQKYFKSSMNTIEKIINELNRELNSCDYVSYNDFLYRVGLPLCDCGDQLGWNRGKSGLIEFRPVPIKYDDGTYVTGVSFNVAPYYGYKGEIWM